MHFQYQCSMPGLRWNASVPNHKNMSLRTLCSHNYKYMKMASCTPIVKAEECRIALKDAESPSPRRDHLNYVK